MAQFKNLTNSKIFLILFLFYTSYNCTGWPLLQHSLQLDKKENSGLNPFLILILGNIGQSNSSSSSSSSSSSTTTSSSLSAPVLQTATGSTTSVALTWASVTGATSYTVYYSTTSTVTTSSTSIVAGNVTTYTIQSLTNGTLYYFAIKASNATTSSTLSNILSATPVQVQCLSQGYCNTFVTAAIYTGNIGGLTTADAICAAAKPGGLPGTGTDYKAMLVVAGSRDFSTSTNWVLYANTQYRQQDATTIIGTTNALGNFVVNLTNPINPGGGASAFWSGWVNTLTCSGWTSTAGNGEQGACCGLTTIPGAVSTGNTACTSTRSIVCAQQ
jgi:hypothetical protein